MADRNTYLKMMLNNGKTQNSSIPDVKDYVANLGLNDEDIADFLIKNNEIYANQVLTESQQQLQTQEQPLNQEKEEDKNWWQNIVDGMASIGNAVIDGIMNFADDIGDFFISVGDWMMGGNNEWADEAINYDWQAQVTNALNFMQPLLQGGDVVQNYNDWAQSIWQGPETSREYLNGVVEGTWTDNDFGKFLRDAANSIGYMLPTIAVGVLTGGSSAAALSTMGVVAGMGQTSDAYQENNNMGLALLSGIVAGGIEAGTEAIGGFIPGSKTITKTTIKAIGKQMLEEGAEEVVSGFLQPVVDSIAKGNAKPWFDDNGQFVYFSPEFWFTGEDSVARQGALGAFTGGIFGGANIVQNRIKYGKAGQQFGQAYQEFVETRNEARELKSKNKSTDAIEQKLGEASVYLAEKANQLKTAIEDGSISNRQVKNLAEMLHNPNANRTMLAENINENINILNKTTNLNEHILRDLVSDFNISNNSNFKLDIVDDLKDANGNSVNAQFNENTNTISLNSSILDNNAYSVLGHELLAHGVLDNILTNSNTRSLVFNLVNNDTEWVNKNKQAILKEYNTTENSELYKSELVANYLQEKLINNNSLSDLELLASNKGVFKEFLNSAKLIMENTNSSKLKQQIRKAVRQFGKSNYRVNSIVLKMLNDRKLNKKEQEYYDQNKTLFDTYFDIVNGTNEIQTEAAYSRELSNEEKESLAEKSFNNINNLTENDIKKINKRYADVLLDYESFKKFINNAIFNNKNTNEYGIFGKVDKKLAEKLKQATKIDYENVFLALNKSDTKHTYNRHVLNRAKGIKMEIDDLYLLPYFLEKIEKVKLEDNGNLKFNIRLNDLYDVILRMYGNGKNNKFKLCLKSLYIIEKGANPSVSDTTNAPLYTSETSSESLTPLSNKSITQENDSVNTIDENGKVKYSKNLNNLTDAEKTSLGKLNKTIDEKHKQKFLKVIRTKYFENLATSPLIDKFTNRDIDYFKIATQRNLTSEEIASLDIYKYAKDYTKNHPQLDASKYPELVKQVEVEFEETILKQAIERNGGKELPRGRKLLYVTGLPGAGKSSGSVEAFLKNNAAIEFDNDIAKTVPSLADYYDGGLGANTVQQIVSEAQENLTLKLLKEGYNIVYPAIGKKINKVKKQLQSFIDNNYQVRELEYVHVDNLTSQNRAFIRYLATGRFVDPIDYIKDSVANGPELTYNQIEKEFNDGSRLFTKISKIDNSGNIRQNNSVSNRTELQSRGFSDKKHSQEIRVGNNERRPSIFSNEGKEFNRTNINSLSLRLSSEVDINVLETNKANKVKENANKQLWQKVISFKDAKITYNSLIDFINNSLNIDLTVKNKDTKIRALFDSYNVNELNNTLSDFSKDLLNSKVYQGVETTLRDVFEANDFNTVKLENAITRSLKNVLDNKAKTSETTKIFNNLQAQLLKAADLINRYKNRARQFASLYKKVENIKKKLKIENNNTKLTDIKLDEVNLLKYLVSGRIFTKDGGISGTWRTRFNNLMKEDVNYFSSLRNSVFNENGELNKAIETFEYLGNSFNLRRKQQRTLNIEEADALIQAFNSVLSAMNDYKNGYYEKVEKLSNDLYSEQSEIIEANKNSSLTVSKINQIISRVSSPLTNLAVYFGGENTHMYKELIGNIENNYERYLFDQSLLNNSLIEKLEAISKKGILTNQTKIIKNFKGLKRLNKWHLYSMWLNLKAESNLARVSEKGFTLKDKVGQVQHIKYDANLLSDIESHLDGVEIEQLQTLLDFYNVEIKDYIKKAQTKIDGFSNVLSSTYYPQITSKSELKGNLTGDEPLFLRDNGQFKNLKARTGVITSLDLVNPLELVRSYIDSASRYSNLTQAERLLNRTLNKNIEVNNDTTSLRKLFKERYGNEFERQLTSFFNKLTGNLNIVSDSLIAKIGGMSSVAMLGFNVSTVFKQLGSLPMAGNVIGFRNLISGLKGNLRIKKLHNQLYESNGYYRNRVDENGYVFANTMANDVVSKASNIKKKIIDFSLKGMQFMDQYVVLLSYQGAQDYVYRLHNKDINYKPGSELNIKEASKVMNKILLQTQSNAYAISTSMLRSGEMGDLMRYTFGVFGSDNQNKISELYQQFGTIVKQSNYIKALKKKLATDLSQSDKTLYEARLKEAQSNYKNTVKRLTIHSIPNLAIGAVITSLVAVLMKYLLGRDKGEEWDDYLLEFSMDTFVDWIPFVGTIYNAFQYDDGNFSPIPFEQFITLFEVMSNCISKISSGNLTQREVITQITKLFTALSMTAGIPTKNVTNLIIGITDKFSAQTALNMQSLLYGYSQSYYTRLMKESLERNDYKNYAIYYKTNAELFKVNELSDKVLNKIINLKKIGYDVTLKNVPDTLKDENGEEFTLTDKQITEFREIYSLANQSAVNVLEGVRFNKLSSQDQATVLRKVFDAYYDYAKSVVSKTEPTSRAAKVIAMTDGKINISKYISYAQDLLNIEGKDKKEQILKKMKQYYLSDFEKDIILYLVGYDVEL